MYSRVGTTLKHCRTPLELTRTDSQTNEWFGWSCWKRKHPQLGWGRIKPALPASMQRGVGGEGHLLAGVGSCCCCCSSCDMILFTSRRFLTHIKSWWRQTAAKAWDAQSCRWLDVSGEASTRPPGPAWQCGWADRFFFLHNVPVECNDKRHRANRDKVARQREVKKIFFFFFLLLLLFFLTDQRRLPRTSAVPRAQLGWNEASFSIFFHLVLLLPSSLLPHSPHRLSRWHFQKAAETSWCFRPAREKMTKWGTGWVEELVSTENERLIRFTSH